MNEIYVLFVVHISVEENIVAYGGYLHSLSETFSNKLLTITIKYLKILTESSASWTFFSLALSKADVASSNSSILGFLTSALAIAIRCF